MKAKSGTVVGRRENYPKDDELKGYGYRERPIVEFPGQASEGGREVAPEDELIMVMFPKVAWDATQKLSEKCGKSVGETISYALKLLDKTLEEKR